MRDITKDCLVVLKIVKSVIAEIKNQGINWCQRSYTNVKKS